MPAAAHVMEREVHASGPPSGRSYTVTRPDSTTPNLLGRPIDAGKATELLSQTTVIGRIEYGPLTQPPNLLQPRTINPASSICFELRKTPGTAFQPRNALFGAKHRAIRIDFAGAHYELFSPLGRLVLASSSSRTVLRWHRGGGRVTTDAAGDLELLVLLLAGSVTRHLSRLSM